MDKCRLQVKAAIIYLSLMFPESARHRLLSLLLPEEKVKELLDFEESNVEYLRANARGTIEYFTESLSEQPKGDQMSDSVVFTFLDTLFNNKSEVDLVVRSRILASTKTLCAAYRMAYGNNELGLTLQQAYDVLSLVAGTQPIDFTTGDNFYYGSYIGIDCLSSEELIQEQDEQSLLEEDVLCCKLPRFSYMIKGQEEEYLTRLYNHLSDEKYCLFTKETCSLVNFLALFEGVSGYESRFPQCFCAASSFAYWGTFLSTIYKGNSGFKLLDGNCIPRCQKKDQNGLSISGIAMSIIKDQKGKPCRNPSSFNRGSGSSKKQLKSEDRTLMEIEYESVLKQVSEEIRKPSEIRKTLNTFLKKNKKL